jgi:hypothetical protein
MKRRDFVKALGVLGISVPLAVDLEAAGVNISTTTLDDVDPDIGKDLKVDLKKVMSPMRKTAPSNKGFNLPPQAVINDIVMRIGSYDMKTSEAAMEEFCVIIQDGVNASIREDIVFDIFHELHYVPESPNHNSYCVFSLPKGIDSAYIIPNHGHVPDRLTEGDHVAVPNYEIASSIDWRLVYCRDVRWDILGAAIEAFIESFRSKLSTDAWNTLIAAAFDRNNTVSGQSIMLIEKMKEKMREDGRCLTDAYTSPELIQSWFIEEYGEKAWQEAIKNKGLLYKGIKIHFHDSFSYAGEANRFITYELGLPPISLKSEMFCLGLDQSNGSYPFYITRPETQKDIMLYSDSNPHRQRRAGMYGWGLQGISVLNNKYTILGRY